ncbi:MAG TPA: hypothetical protein VGP77_13070 [Vicinamibacterales bacterium]|jgi:hypothetical protein|nr:hypothetical protein [Vicinamibacterales bacterium]
MESRVVGVETRRLPLSDGDWILVKDRLNSGENKRMVKRGSVMTADGATVDLVEAGTAKVLAFLSDWSFKDRQGEPLVIARQPPAVVEAALDLIDPDSYTEILRAIEAHEIAMQAERDAQKKIQPGGNPSSTPSPSLAPATSPTTGSNS